MILALILVFAALGPLLVLLWRQLGQGGRNLTVTPGWIEELSIDRYRVMLSLLNDDWHFLRAQPGFTPRMAVKLRAQRCRIFRGYLRCLEADFGRVCMALKVLLLRSQCDRPDLASALLQNQIRFNCSMALVRLQMLLYRWGLGRVDAAALLGVFDGLRAELQTLVPTRITVGV